MQNRNIQVIFIILILIIPSLGFIQENEEPKNDPEGSSLRLNDNYLEQSDEKIIRNSRSAGLSRQDTAHGGSWLDSFEDDTKIEWGMSDHLRLEEGDAEINGTYSLGPNAVGMWHFDEGLGTTAYDATTNYNDGTINGASWAIGKYGSALSFDGINDYVVVPDSNSLKITEAITIAVWIYWKGSGASTNFITGKSYEQYEIHTGGGGGSQGIRWIPAGHPSSTLDTGNNVFLSNQWNHLAVTYTSGVGGVIYINGNNIVQTPRTPNLQSTTSNFFIGRRGNGDFEFNGLIDEVAIFNKTLSALEIKDIYENNPNRNFRYANVTSNPITHPPTMQWDTLMINKSEPENTYINITVLDASNNQPIPGCPTYTNNGEVDISYIDPVQYPAIKLNATFEGNGSSTSTLHYWAVSWNRSNAWQDTFFGGVKVDSQINIEVIDGNAQAMRKQTEFEVDGNTVALWHFNEGSGTTANDETNNNNDGTLGGDGSGTDLPTWTSGKFGNGMEFDGVDDYIEVSDSSSLDITNSISISIWIRIPIVNSQMYLFEKGDNYRICTTDLFQYLTLILSSTQVAKIPVMKFNDNTWHNLVWIYDTTTGRGYVDGTEVGNPISTSPTVNSNSNDLIIGKRSINVDYFKGIIDEVAIFNKALTAQEIRDHYLKNGFENYSVLESKPISIPSRNYYDRLIINKSESTGNYYNVSILDGQTATPIQNFEELSETNIDISSISPKDHPSIILKGIFESDGEDTAVLHDWSFNWTQNTKPKILDIISPTEVYRTRSAIISVNLSDNEDIEANLTLQAKYKSPSDVDWQTEYLSATNYNFDHWECNFTPTLSVEIGFYSFNFTCNDSFQFFAVKVESDLIKVVNFKATAPEVIISPSEPMTFQDLTVIARNSTDGETPAGQLEYWYRWYKDELYMPVFENLTFIPETSTVKGETWRCVVIPFDLEEPGRPGEAEITIMNTPPFLVEKFNYFTMVEDSSMILEDKLTQIFREIDEEALEFTVTGQNNISVNIIQQNGTIELTPRENWFGTEYITFYANDSFITFDENITVKYENKSFQLKSQEIVMIEVFPANDLPSIVQVGNQNTQDDYPELGFIANQGDWLNLTIIVDDIDLQNTITGIQYSLNITESDNLYLVDNTIYFNPHNKDVGWHYIKISITDGNETPIEYISQDLRINVLNVNDPPTVQIIAPTKDQEFFKTDSISFSCLVDDPDLYLQNSNEKLTYRWSTNNTEFAELGTVQNLTDISSLKSGSYNVTVVITDSSNAKATDHVHIYIKDEIKNNGDGGGGTSSKEVSSDLFLWLALIIVIIIVILIIVFFVIMNQKKKRQLEERMGIPEQELLHPVGAYQPPSIGTPTIAQGVGTSTQLAQPQAVTQSAPISSAPPQELLGPTPTVQSQAQLPPVQPPVPPEKTSEPELTLQQKLALLEKRLLQGEISEETFLNLKDKYELEAKPFQPAPQLPPAQTPLTTPEQTTALVQVQQALTPEQQPSREPSDIPRQNAPPETVQIPMEQPMVTETPIEPVQQQAPEMPPELPADAYQQPQVQQTQLIHQPPQPHIQTQPTSQPQPTAQQPPAQPIGQPQTQESGKPESKLTPETKE